MAFLVWCVLICRHLLAAVTECHCWWSIGELHAAYIVRTMGVLSGTRSDQSQQPGPWQQLTRPDRTRIYGVYPHRLIRTVERSAIERTGHAFNDSFLVYVVERGFSTDVYTRGTPGHGITTAWTHTYVCIRVRCCVRCWFRLTKQVNISQTQCGTQHRTRIQAWVTRIQTWVFTRWWYPPYGARGQYNRENTQSVVIYTRYRDIAKIMKRKSAVMARSHD